MPGRPTSAHTLLIALAAWAAPAGAADLSGEIGLVSDYRYRGLSLSGGRPALQASLSVEHGSGAYAEVWGSSLEPDGWSSAEIDGTVGYGFDLTETLSADISATYYTYPGDTDSNAIELGGSLEAAHGPLTASLGISVAPPQSGTRDDLGRRRANVYAFSGASYRLSRLPVSLRAGLGYEQGPWDMAQNGGKWDWSIGAEIELEGARMALDAIGSDTGEATLVGALALRF